MSNESIVSSDDDEQALEARQHRMERRRSNDKKRPHQPDDSDHDDDAYTSDNDNDELHTKKKKARVPLSSIRGIKKQARYEPAGNIAMTKKELAQWRKEARRVRNRESAAASRRKTRDRIEELEGQVRVVETKYQAALQRIAQLEMQQQMQPQAASAAGGHSVAVSPVFSPVAATALQENTAPHHWSLDNQQAAHELANSVQEEEEVAAVVVVQQKQQQPPQPPITISRPTAV